MARQADAACLYFAIIFTLPAPSRIFIDAYKMRKKIFLLSAALRRAVEREALRRRRYFSPSLIADVCHTLYFRQYAISFHAAAEIWR